mmetsp:Transcript_47336/g.115276  ORF Transcript_47336/g.115276 Transcript_47336/m.115276 type:complete len:80 (-) Transcript_47336:160-399(-)
MQTAQSAVLEADPAAMVEARLFDVFPIKVTVNVVKDGKEVPIFSAPQRELFRKNAAMRKASVEEIKAAVRRAMKSSESA